MCRCFMGRRFILSVALTTLSLSAPAKVWAMNVTAHCTPIGGVSVANGKSTPITKASQKAVSWTYAWYAGKSDAKITLKSGADKSVTQDASVMESSPELVTFVVLEKNSFWSHTLLMSKDMMHATAIYSEHSQDEKSGSMNSQQVRLVCKVSM